MITISHIKWSVKNLGKCVGIFTYKMVPGNNEFQITYKDKNGERPYPGVYIVNKELEMLKRGPVPIQRGQKALGVWIRLEDVKAGMYDKRPSFSEDADDAIVSVCDTAPYPKCNGANGCDTCEHEPEE